VRLSSGSPESEPTPVSLAGVCVSARQIFGRRKPFRIFECDPAITLMCGTGIRTHSSGGSQRCPEKGKLSIHANRVRRWILMSNIALLMP